ncbi:MAG: hypothetical protein ACRD1Z_11530, partial [Vicinamibacteria bacterium]
MHHPEDPVLAPERYTGDGADVVPLPEERVEPGLAIAAKQLFPTFDFDLFNSIGNQIGMAAENALLFQRTVRQSKEIKVLNNIARVISSSLQIEEVFDAFANEMEKLIAFDRLSVAFLDESGSY